MEKERSICLKNDDDGLTPKLPGGEGEFNLTSHHAKTTYLSEHIILGPAERRNRSSEQTERFLFTSQKASSCSSTFTHQPQESPTTRRLLRDPEAVEELFASEQRRGVDSRWRTQLLRWRRVEW